MHPPWRDARHAPRFCKPLAGLLRSHRTMRVWTAWQRVSMTVLKTPRGFRGNFPPRLAQNGRRKHGRPRAHRETPLYGHGAQACTFLHSLSWHAQSLSVACESLRGVVPSLSSTRASNENDDSDSSGPITRSCASLLVILLRPSFLHPTLPGAAPDARSERTREVRAWVRVFRFSIWMCLFSVSSRSV